MTPLTSYSAGCPWRRPPRLLSQREDPHRGLLIHFLCCHKQNIYNINNVLKIISGDKDTKNPVNFKKKENKEKLNGWLFLIAEGTDSGLYPSRICPRD